MKQSAPSRCLGFSRRRRTGKSGAVQIGLPLGQLGQSSIRLLLLQQGLIEQLRCVVQASKLGPAAQSAIAGDLIVLDGLGSSDQACIESRATGKCLQYLLPFSD